MLRSIPRCGLVVVLLAAAAPAWLEAQDTPLAEAQSLLASGRAVEAERLIERIVARRPLVAPELPGQSSDLAILYLRVRARMLPVMADTLYGAAKTAYDEGRLDVASSQFEDLRRLVDSAETRLDVLNDLGMLAEGFSRLIRRQLEPRPTEIPLERVLVAVEARTDAPPFDPPGPLLEAVLPEPVAEEPQVSLMALLPPAPATAPANSGEARPFAPWRPQLYGPADPDVTPPVTIDQRLPAWVAPAGFSRRTFRGLLAVVVGEDGLVASAEIVTPSFAAYDAVLLSVAKRWRYEPAGKDGRAVRFRKIIEINLLGRSGT